MVATSSRSGVRKSECFLAWDGLSAWSSDVAAWTGFVSFSTKSDVHTLVESKDGMRSTGFYTEFG
jgi:hypothetical protein